MHRKNIIKPISGSVYAIFSIFDVLDHLPYRILRWLSLVFLENILLLLSVWAVNLGSRLLWFYITCFCFLIIVMFFNTGICYPNLYVFNPLQLLASVESFRSWDSFSRKLYNWTRYFTRPTYHFAVGSLCLRDHNWFSLLYCYFEFNFWYRKKLFVFLIELIFGIFEK